MTAHRFRFLLLALALTATSRAFSAEPLTFEQHVRPILKANCFHCHGDEDEKEANLDLRLARLITKAATPAPASSPATRPKASSSSASPPATCPPKTKASH